MGDPRKVKKQYQTPSHPWNRGRLETESVLRKQHATKNKKEIWKMDTILMNLQARAQTAISAQTAQGFLEKDHLLQKVFQMGLLSADAKLDDILNLKTEDVFNRRLSTIMILQKMANTTKQARQMVVHGHIAINGVKITSPSYLVPRDEEDKIAFIGRSTFLSAEHPEMMKIAAKQTAREKAEATEAGATDKDKKAATEKKAFSKPKGRFGSRKPQNRNTPSKPKQPEKKQEAPAKAQ